MVFQEDKRLKYLDSCRVDLILPLYESYFKDNYISLENDIAIF